MGMTKMPHLRRVTDPVTGETCKMLRHRSGMEIWIAEQPEFHTAAAQLGVRFGSVHTQFDVNGGTHRIPAGTAHFLEHTVFERDGEDASVLLNRLGAADNAYTTFDRTVFYFQTQQNFQEALEILLRFVLHPHFTAESIEKERPIITQEICEYLDAPDDRLFYGLMNGLYRSLPVREDVAGSAESIAQITPALLERCHAAFYRPEHMVLCCAGNLPAEMILETADRLLPHLPPLTAVPVFQPEPAAPARRRICRRMAVSKTQFSIGFKSGPVQGDALLIQTQLGELVLELIAGAASPLYAEMHADGLINDCFSTSAFTGERWFVLMAEGESDDPEEVLARLNAEIARVLREGIDAERFAALQRAAYGDALLSVNTPAAASSAMLDACMMRLDSPYAERSCLAALTPADALTLLRERLNPEQVCLSVITPMQDREPDTKG